MEFSDPDPGLNIPDPQHCSGHYAASAEAKPELAADHLLLWKERTGCNVH
jgi:hypothetical protein